MESSPTRSDVHRIAVFIDGADFDETLRALGTQVDYRKLRQAFDQRGRLLRAFYYAPAQEDALISMRPLLDWLTYNGYEVREKPLDQVDRGYRRRQASMAVHLAIDVLELAPHLDTVILVTGDNDYQPLVAAVKARGVRVLVVSTLKSKPAMIGNTLRRQADEFIDVADILPEITLQRRRVLPADAP